MADDSGLLFVIREISMAVDSPSVFIMLKISRLVSLNMFIQLFYLDLTTSMMYGVILVSMG